MNRSRRDVRIRRLAGLAAVLAFPALWAAAPARAGSLPRPDAGPQYSSLESVSADSATDAWAVGWSEATSGGTQLALTEHWNGTAWKVVSAPSLGTDGGVLNGVTALSPTDVWAVGVAWTTSGASRVPGQTVILHWNGHSWTQVTSPDPSTDSNELTSVTAISADDIWAVGQDGTYSSPDAASLILHWNGTAWTQVASPDPSTGTYPDNNLTGVSGDSASDVWAVGYYQSSSLAEATLVLHWNGTAWTQVTSPDPADYYDILQSVSAVSPTDAWAVGYDGALSGSASQSLVLQWNGSTWSQVTSPDPGATYNELDGVSADAATDAQTVGASGDPRYTIEAQWNGSTWTQSSDTFSTYLYSVDALSPTDAWAVGETVDGQKDISLITYWNGTTWSRSAHPS
jgi:hypothetical protein